MGSNSVEVVRGTLEVLILKTLSAGRSMHGFDMLEWIYEATDGALAIHVALMRPRFSMRCKAG